MNSEDDLVVFQRSTHVVIYRSNLQVLVAILNSIKAQTKKKPQSQK